MTAEDVLRETDASLGDFHLMASVREVTACGLAWDWYLKEDGLEHRVATDGRPVGGGVLVAFAASPCARCAAVLR